MVIHKDGWQLLLNSGLLYKINKDILFKYGVALTVHKAVDGTVTLDGIYTSDDNKPLGYLPEEMEAGQAKLDAFNNRSDIKALLNLQNATPSTIDDNPDGHPLDGPPIDLTHIKNSTGNTPAPSKKHPKDTPPGSSVKPETPKTASHPTDTYEADE